MKQKILIIGSHNIGTATLGNAMEMLSEETKKAMESVIRFTEITELNQNKSKKLGKGGRARNKSGFKNKFK